MKKIIFITLAVLMGMGGYFFYSNFLQEKRLPFDMHHMVNKGISFDKWIKFNPKGESFKAVFPLKPTEVSRELPIPGSDASLNYHEYQCVTEQGRLFSVSYTTLPDSFLNWGDSLVLNGALKLIMRELGKVNLVGKDSNTFKTFPSLDYEHYTKDQETAGTLILVGATLYKVEVTYPLNDREGVHDELCNFVESFEPVKKEASSKAVKEEVTSSSQHQSSDADIPQSQ